MKRIKTSIEQAWITIDLLRWTVLVLPVSLIVGSLVALFLFLLDVATKYRWQHEWLLFLLPVAGVAIHFLYKLSGKNAEKGNNLIIDEIHEPRQGVPLRMAPLVLLTTVVTHLFGGSAGREGTAVQIGGSIAQMLGKWLKLTTADIRIMLMAGMAAGFGAVFGTPVTGAIFALEVLTIGRIKYDALLPCFIASMLADVVCTAWGIHHTQYKILFSAHELQSFGFLHFDFLLLAKSILAGILFGLVGYLFSKLSHSIKDTANKYLPVKWLIPVVGGCVIIALTFMLGTYDYLGLGVTTADGKGASIVNAYTTSGVTDWSWLWKIIFTAVTLGTGFKGGEVTPLFFIGAALGHTLAIHSGAPIDLFAGLGFIAVFAAATNTPLACTIMGVELFGADNLVYYAVACFTAYFFSGHTGIYRSQRLGEAKYSKFIHLTGKKTLKEIQEENLNDI
jgi:H+/Cl- antiporter ClcA